jgi:gliding motility-associated-like protein
MATTACDQYKVILPAMVSGGNGGPYTYNWSNGGTAATTSVIANYNNTPNTYTLTAGDGCTIPSVIAIYTINVNPIPTATFVSTLNKGCAPFEINFTAVPTGSNNSGINYVWDFGGDNNGGPNSQVYNGPIATVSYPTAGTYNVGILAANQFGCSSYFSIANYVEVYPVPFAEFSANPQTVTILEPNIHFTNFSQGGSTYTWNFGDWNSLQNSSSAMNPQHEYAQIGEYSVYMVVTNSYGCTDTAKHVVVVEADYALYIPNAFTPDQNSRNDVFQPKGVGINEDKYKMEIFDRWGELIFTSNQFSKGWDGTVKGSSQVAQDGVYIYKIYVVDLKGNKKQYVGHVTLLKQ